MSHKSLASCFYRKEPSLIILYDDHQNKQLQFRNLSVIERHAIMRNPSTSWSVISFMSDNLSESLISVVHYDNIRINKISSPFEKEMLEEFRKDYGRLYNRKATELANMLDSELEHYIVGNCAFVLDDHNNALQSKILALLNDYGSDLSNTDSE